ncbi:MAG: hemolysin III [Betaproteobacteria bacterium RIFCSPLOWO2_02_FULL_65_24]|nr:MAG: hemolysin III [Betaproteobacteria bacterium RIFCSPLOWO2_02_FULL_65_24]OGA33902.1 MAG: hemolysin III [Betaproteobacteria bacterium RIFCSPLOWO2_12_FULL_62_13b]
MYYGERLNSFTHLAGTVLAAAGAPVLIVLAARSGDAWKIVGCSIFGAALFLLYCASTLYHSVRGRAKAILRKLDHCSIYLLIAGTYTPFALVTLRGPWGWSLFGLTWGLAAIGIAQEFVFGKGTRRLSILIYAVMGWMAVAALGPLTARLGAPGLAWLLAGGLLYSGGIVFYLLDERVRHFHGVWHLFVLGGSAAHFIAIAFYVI